jgi:hypothetical protein
VPRLRSATAIVPRDPALLALLVTGFVARLLALWTWPFLVEGDGADYVERLVEGQSSLLQASGYVFFLRPVAWVAALTGADVAVLLRHTLPWLGLAVVVVLYLSLRAVIGRATAGAACIVLAVDPLQLAAASTSRPEYLQLCWWTLVIAATAHCVARTARSGIRGHALLGACLGAAFLTKFNSLALAPFALAAVLAGAIPWRQRVRRALAVGGGFGAVLAVFLVAFHRPSTGTWSLNRGVGWHRMCNLATLGVRVHPEAGPATALAHRIVLDLPPVAPGAGPFRHVRAVPAAVRQPFVARWDALLDEPQQLASAAPVRHGDTAEGTVDLRDPTAFCRLYHFLGLRATERLLAEVYVEALRRDPADAWSGFAVRLDDGARLWRHYVSYLPTSASHATGAFAGARRSVLRLADAPAPVVQREVAPHAWEGGAAVLGALALLPRIPASIVWAALAAGLLRHVLVRRPGTSTAAWLAFGCLASAIALVLFSALALSFRLKELIAALPLIAIGLALPFAPARPLPTAAADARPPAGQPRSHIDI